MLAFLRSSLMILRIWPPAGIAAYWCLIQSPWDEKYNGGFLFWILCLSEYMLPFTSKPLWPRENKKLNVVEIDSCPIIICLVSMWPGHRALLLEEETRWGGGYYKSREHIGAAINRESCSQSCLLLLLQFQNSDFVAGMGDEWVGAAERTPQITHTQRKREERKSRRWRRQSPWRWW